MTVSETSRNAASGSAHARPGSGAGTENDEVIAIKASGQIIRSAVSGVPVKGRDTMGVKFVGVRDGDAFVVIALNPESPAAVAEIEAAADDELAEIEGSADDDEVAAVDDTDLASESELASEPVAEGVADSADEEQAAGGEEDDSE
jgi:DNA gyrase subunit A